MNRNFIITTDSGHKFPVSVPATYLQTVDSNAMTFFISQLTGLEAKIYETKYPRIRYQDFIPVDTSFPEYVQSIDYRSYDGRGIAKFVGASAQDLPKIAMSANITNVPVGYGGVEFDYSMEELRTSQALAMPVDIKKGEITFRVAQEHMQEVAFFGDKDHKMQGLLNNENVTITSTDTDWAALLNGSGTAANYQTIVNDMNNLLKTVAIATKEAYIPDTLILPAEKYTALSGVRMANGTDTSVIEWFKKNNYYTERTGRELNLDMLFQLDGMGSKKKGRMIAYTKDPECVKLYQPMPFRMLPPQAVKLTIVVPCEYKTSGTEFLQPLSAIYCDFTV